MSETASIDLTPTAQTTADSASSVRFSLSELTARVQKFGAALALLPVLLTFLFYVYNRGAADAFGVPNTFVRPDPTKLYEAALFAIPIVLLLVLVGLSSTSSIAAKSAASVDSRSPSNGLSVALLGRLFIATAYGSAAYFFARPSQDDPNLYSNIFLTVLLIFVCSCLPIVVAATARKLRGASGIFSGDDDPVVKFGGGSELLERSRF